MEQEMMLRLKYLPGQKSTFPLTLEHRKVQNLMTVKCKVNLTLVFLKLILPRSGYDLQQSLLLVSFCVFTYFLKKLR